MVVASGNCEQTARWGNLLRMANVTFEARRLIDEHLPTRPDYVELWVAERDMEKGRQAIRKADDSDKSLLW
jgi:hypothetical protein